MFSKRVAVPVSIVTVALLASACDDASSKERKAEQTQAQADQQKATAEQQAADKSAAAWDAAAQEVENAQAKADRARDAAAAAMNDDRNDYMNRVNKVITEMDSRLSDFRASAYDAGATQRSLTADVMSNMDRRRAALVDDETALQKTTIEAWPALRLKIDTDLDDSRNYMRTASASIKGSRH
jgi:hypothetical protein